MFYIYQIKNSLNDKVYIGKSNNPNLRWKKHLYFVKAGPSHPCYSYIHAAIGKYGVNNFITNILEECSSENESYLAEQKWISHFNSTDLNKGYNLNKGGIGGYSPSQETRKKIGLARTGSKHPMYGRRGILNPYYNKPFSKTHLENLRIAIKQRKSGGENNSNCKLTENQVREIRAKYIPRRYTKPQLSLEYGVSIPTIDAIVRNKTWVGLN